MAYLLQTVKWGLVVGAAALVLAPLRPRLDRRYRARWRYWLWMVLAFALLLAPLPWSSLLPEAAEEALVPAVVLEVPRTLGPAAEPAETNNNNSGGEAVRPSPPAETGGGTAAGAETAVPPAQTFPAIRWDRALPALWLIVAALLLLWRLLGSWRFSRRARRWSRAPGEAVLAACRSAEAELGMRREIPVWICPLADSPMAVGLFRPRLLLPDEDYDARRLRFILRHELTHIRRRDLWYKLLLLAAACLHWFDPLVWLLRRQAERDLELTCDDAVTAGLSGGDRRAYGETLLADLGRRRGLTSPLSTRFRGGKAAMKERLRNLLAAPRRWGGPALAAALALVALAACSFGIRQAAAFSGPFLEPYQDIRDIWAETTVYPEEAFQEEDILTFTFNEGTVLEGSEELQEQIMEAGKNPGLGVRPLHDQGITGEGVRVAIIDQNLLLDHPEFTGKIEAYYDTGCEQPEDEGSAHAPAMTSLLVGESMGVAPGATVYYAAVPAWKEDNTYYAAGLNWIVEQNEELPEGEKIRVVVASQVTGLRVEKNMKQWDEAVKAAQAAGILVLDSRSDEKTGIIFPAFYDPADPESVWACTGGSPDRPYRITSKKIGAPCSYRTMAEEYWEGEPSYQYFGTGWPGFCISYAAGVLALGWQVAPELDGDTMLQLLKETCSISHDGSTIIDPTAFIEAVREAHGLS